MLHSHLPFYRKAGMWPFGEESFYECMAETYIPLLNMVAELWEEGLPANITIGITPVLAEQMNDEHLKEGFLKFIDARIDAAKGDEERFQPRGESPDLDKLHLARFYLNWFQKTRDDFVNRWKRDLLGGFKQYQDLGAIEITTSAATHCFSPLLATDSSLNAQYKIGVDTYKKYFGRAPRGAWLPECAYRPANREREGVEKWLHENGIKYFFVESHQIKGGTSVEMRRVFGAYRTIEYIPAAKRRETGLDTTEAYWLKDHEVAIMGRDEEAGYQVWSADHGYPGDGNYREFHKKDDVSGLHYWKLTSQRTDLGFKELYNPEAAMERIRQNADHYVGVVQAALTNHVKQTGQPGLLMVAFDTELFGHWWFEGIAWIKDVLKKLKQYTAVTPRTASGYLEAFPPTKAMDLPESSWGAGGHFQVWYNHETEWMWPIIHQCERTIEKLAKEHHNGNPLMKRAIKQAIRETLLLQSSDWPFLVTTGQAKQYAVERFNSHKERWETLIDMIESGKIDEKKLSEIEDIDNCFQDVDLSAYIIEEKAEVVSK
jgi:1,4-alpha-glucan branching enzyme